MGKKKNKKKNKSSGQNEMNILSAARKNRREEMRQIIDSARIEKRKQEKAKISRSRRSFTWDDVNAFISDLKFKDEEENRKVPPQRALIDRPKESATIKKTVTYYDKWYRLVTSEQP